MRRKIKILHFITDSGNHPYLNVLIGFADKSVFEVSVGSLNSEGDLQNNCHEREIQTFALGTDKRSKFPKAVYELTRWLVRNQIDIVQTHLFDASLVGLTAAKLAGTPLKILTGHHSHEMQFYKKKLSYYGDYLSSRILSDYIIAPSAQMKELFIESEGVPADKIAVIHHGFDFDKWKPSEEGREKIRREFNLENKIVFAAVGKIFWIKNYPMLLKAFKILTGKFPNAVLMIVGSGDQTELTDLADDLKIKDRVIFTGWRKDISDIFSAIDIFVHPSIAESFGLVIAEAMAMGKPVICSDVGIAREIIDDGKNGFVVSVDDAQRFGSAMAKMIDKKEEWNEIGSINQDRVKTLTAEKMVRGYEECYIKWLKK